MHQEKNVLIALICVLRVVLCSSLTLLHNGKKEATDCTIYLKDLDRLSPAFLRPTTRSSAAQNAIFLPDRNGYISFARGDTLDLACPGGTLMDNGLDTEKTILQAICIQSSYFTINNEKSNIYNIRCNKNIQSTAKYTGRKCAKNHSEVEIGIDVEKRFIRHITVCFDRVRADVVYSIHHLSSSIAVRQPSKRPRKFIIDGFYNQTSQRVDFLYRRKTQQVTINGILQFPNSSTEVVKDTGNLFLARGHISPRGDFHFAFQHRLTFYYINAAPQWQSFNGGNWVQLENSCRNFVNSTGFNLTVFTGIHETMHLKDLSFKKQNLYLDPVSGPKLIAVPKYYWKVLYEPNTKAGIAAIGVNNPYIKNNHIGAHTFCKNICHRVPWIVWKPLELKKGYAYCCDVNEFRKVVSSLPDFQVTQLLAAPF